MWLLDLLAWIAGHHLLPAVFASACMFVGLALIFAVLRVRRASEQVSFLYIVLLKAGLAAWAGESLSCLSADRNWHGTLGLRLPDLVPSGSLLDVAGKLNPTGTWGLAGMLGSLGGALLLYRWSRVAPTYRRLHESRQARLRDFAAVVQVFEGLVTRSFGGHSWPPRPRLMILYDPPAPAFTMGLRPPVVVLSADLAAELGLGQLEGILAHELAHIRRWDYLARWLAVMLRDVLIWNPFAHLWYRRVLDQQEKASDAYAAELTGSPEAVASGLVEMGAYLTGMSPIATGPLRARDSRHDLEQLNQRVDLLLGTELAPPARVSSRGVLHAVALIVFALAQPHMVFSLPYVYLLVRGWLR